MIFTDKIIIIIFLPILFFTIYARFRVSRSLKKYFNIRSKNEYRGIEVATELLTRNRLENVDVVLESGLFENSYDHVQQRLCLSKKVYSLASVASMAIVAHEVGHIVQYESGNMLLSLRNSIFPMAFFCAATSWILIFAGLISDYFIFFKLGISFFSFAVLFNLLTLPLEIKISNSAMKMLKDGGLISKNEIEGVEDVLVATAMVEVAGVLTAFVELIKLVLLSKK